MYLRKKLIYILLCYKLFSFADSNLTLQNEICELTVDRNGGMITSFLYKKSKMNPLSWSMEEKLMPQNNKKGAPFRGHFLCVGRWGEPTAGEIRNGIAHNGDITTKKWLVESKRPLCLKLGADSERDKMSVRREMSLDPYNAIFFVRDSVFNTSTIGRLFNIVQHATIGTPFLSAKTIVDTNAAKGFMQDNWLPDPNSRSYHWPKGKLAEGQEINLRRSDVDCDYVSSHIINDSIGWVTAFSPECGLIIGYVWNTRDYPWLNVWHQRVEGNPWAKGLEFGTTGVGVPYNELIANKTSLEGIQSYFFFDANEALTKNFICFMMELPKDSQGVESLEIKGNQLNLNIKGNNNTVITKVLKSELITKL